MLPLTMAQRRELRAQAHALNPVVMIGKSGLSATVIGELERSLVSHELIKIKVQIDDRITRNALLEEICEKLNAAPVQHIGKTVVVYRPNPEEVVKKTERSTYKKKREPFRTKRSFQN